MTSVPDPAEILNRHIALLRVLVAALLSGAKHARSYADWQDEEMDRTLAPALVRKGAKRFLIARGESVDDEELDDVEYEAEYLSNLGLAIGADGVWVRILKSDRGSLPTPGPSKKRQQFYAQQGSLFPIAETDAEPLPALNLVLHWTASEEYNLERVYLACPKAGGVTRASVEAYWDEVIWRSGTAAASNEQQEAQSDELEIYLDDAQSGNQAG